MFYTQPKIKMTKFLRGETLGIIRHEHLWNRKTTKYFLLECLDSSLNCGLPDGNQPNEFGEGIYTDEKGCIPCLTSRKFSYIIN